MSRDWTPREKAIKKAAIAIMGTWGTNDTTPRAQREEIWLEARALARRIFDMADEVHSTATEEETKA